MQGEVPADLGWLSELEELNVARNELEGILPAEWGELKNLKRLTLTGNKFRGSIPKAWEGMKKLEYFWGQDNALTGKVPDFLFRLPVLKRLCLENNFLQLTEEQKKLNRKGEQYFLLPQGEK